MRIYLRLAAAFLLAIVSLSGSQLAHAEGKTHRIAMHISEDHIDTMNRVLGNAKNAIEYFEAKGEKVTIQVVAYGPGVYMLRDDTSPVKERLAEYRKKYAGVSFMACRNTMDTMGKREGKKITVVPEATEVPTGVGHLVELQEQGWSYIKP
jgi:uncharacterized protein